MSTLKVNKIEHTSTTDGGVSIDSSGNVTLPANTKVGTQNLPSSGPLSNRNLIINGNFAINQRGGSNTTINTYALDRWRSYGGPMGFTISQQDVLSTLSTSRYAMRFQRTSGNTQTNNTGVVQGIESKNCEGLAGTQLTLSFKARAGADLSSDLDARFFYGTGTDENPVSMTGMTNDGGTDFTLTTSFATYTKTVTVPAGTTQISLTFAVTPTGTAGTNDWFEIAEVQVERGSVATPFEHRSYGDELARCQRYYQVCIRNEEFVTSCVNSASGANTGLAFVNEMRVAPTVTLATAGSSAGNIAFLTTVGNTPSTIGSHQALSITTYGFRFRASGYSASGWTAGAASNVYAYNTATVYTASAEL